MQESIGQRLSLGFLYSRWINTHSQLPLETVNPDTQSRACDSPAFTTVSAISATEEKVNNLKSVALYLQVPTYHGPIPRAFVLMSQSYLELKQLILTYERRQERKASVWTSSFDCKIYIQNDLF